MVKNKFRSCSDQAAAVAACNYKSKQSLQEYVKPLNTNITCVFPSYA